MQNQVQHLDFNFKHKHLLLPEGWRIPYSLLIDSDSLRFQNAYATASTRMKVHKLFLVVGNVNQGAARQGIKMKSPQLQPQHPSMIKALIEKFCCNKYFAVLTMSQLFSGLQCTDNTITRAIPNYHFQTIYSKKYNIGYAKLNIPHIIYRTPHFFKYNIMSFYDNSL